MTSKPKKIFLCLLLALGASIGAAVASAIEPDVCQNKALRRAIAIIDAACHDLSGCNFDSLRQIEGIRRPELLAALRDPNLYPVHVFFEANVSDVTQARDWSTKKDLLEGYQYITGIEQATVFVLGQASRTGGFDQNVKLSRERMQGILLYMRDHLRIKCRAIKGGYLGSDIFQLGLPDASALRLLPEEFRNDSLVLNQAVHVFIVPCPDGR